MLGSKEIEVHVPEKEIVHLALHKSTKLSQLTIHEDEQHMCVYVCRYIHTYMIALIH